MIVYILDGFFQLGIGPRVSAHFQIFQHGHLQEDAPSFRAERHPLRNNLVRRHAHDVLVVQKDAAAAGLQQSGHGIQRRGFARAVGADQGNDLALVHLEGNSLDGVNAAVVYVEVVHLQQSVAHTSASFFLPR